MSISRIARPYANSRPPLALLSAAFATVATLPVHAEPFAYVTNQASEERIWVIDTATNTLFDTVMVADIPSRVAITPDGSFAYVTIVVSEQVPQESGSILRSTVPSSPVFMGAAASETKSNSFFSNKVEVIETATNTVVATITTDEAAPFAIAITPDGAFAYVTHLGNSVSVIDTETNTVVASVPVEGETLDVAITPDGAYAYVANSTADSVVVIETATNTLVATIDVDDTPAAIAITPDGESAYVTSLTADTVSQIGIPDNTVLATLAVGGGPGGIAITPDGVLAYVTNQLSNDVSVINVPENAVVATVPVGDTPIDVAITPDGALAYVTNIFSDDVSVIDTATNAVVDTAMAGLLPEGIAITPDDPVIEVTIDIKPGNRHNLIVPWSHGAIWVAILSGEEFDALQVDRESVLFGPGEAPVLHYGVRDINRDGAADLLLRFAARDSGIECGDTEATVSGLTFDQQQFAGSDSIKTVLCD